MNAQSSEIYTTIKTISEQFITTFESGDTTKISTFYTENGTLLPPGFDFIIGKNAIKEFWQTAIDMGIKSINLDIIDVELHDDTAIEMSKYSLYNVDNQIIDSGKGIVVWKNINGIWKLHRDIWNSSLEQ